MKIRIFNIIIIFNKKMFWQKNEILQKLIDTFAL